LPLKFAPAFSQWLGFPDVIPSLRTIRIILLNFQGKYISRYIIAAHSQVGPQNFPHCRGFIGCQDASEDAMGGGSTEGWRFKSPRILQRKVSFPTLSHKIFYPQNINQKDINVTFQGNYLFKKGSLIR